MFAKGIRRASRGGEIIIIVGERVESFEAVRRCVGATIRAVNVGEKCMVKGATLRFRTYVGVRAGVCVSVDVLSSLIMT